MIDILDSRGLRRTDCYGQRFMKVGTYRYHVLPVHGECVTEERPYTIQVIEGAGNDKKLKQHEVVVRAEGGSFRIQGPAELIIEVGDLVLWNCRDPKAMPYMVVGEKPFFNSHRLVNESGYSHAFGAAGEYRWKDAHGSKASGIVRVKDPDCRDHAGFQQWHKLLSKGTVVTIEEENVEPREVEILTGQTVFFAIRKAAGIAITDERLLAEKRKTVGRGTSGRKGRRAPSSGR